MLAQEAGWLPKMMGELNRIIEIEKPETKIERLGPFMGIAKDGHGNMTDAQVEVFERARDALVSIPGHALFYRNRIESLRKEVVENSKRSALAIRQLEQEGAVVGLVSFPVKWTD
ncbi:MAG: hypothetical protein EOP84_09015 [Verrucomicrobiaceae bacterium]|nr:MAG: hypothetical protein EOP84_09015 [Verrucomicrobiaceae bacterium]